MTRWLFLLSALLFVAMIGLTIVGLTSSAPALLFVGMLIAGPGFMFTLGVAIGRATKEVAIVPRDDAVAYNNPSNRRIVTRTREPLS